MQKLVLINIGSFRCAALAEDVAAVIEPRMCTSLPPTKVPLVSVSTYENKILPVADFTSMLASKKPAASFPNWLVVKISNDSNMAVIVEGASTWEEIESKEWAESVSSNDGFPSGSLKGFYKASDENPIPVFNFKSFLDASLLDWIKETEILGLEVTPQLVEKVLGKNWMGVFHFFPRLVNHLVSVAMSDPSNLKISMEDCKRQLSELMPHSLDESVPFVVRYLWNRSMTPKTEGYEDVVESYMDCVRMGSKSLDWNFDDLKKSISEIMSGA